VKSKLFNFLLASLSTGLIAYADPAKAVLNYNIFESSGNVVIETDGSLGTLPVQIGDGAYGINGAYVAQLAFILTGPGTNAPIYGISGTTSFITPTGLIPASSASGITTSLYGAVSRFSIDASYVLGTPITSSAIFNGKTLADFGLSPSSGLLGTWNLFGTTETINVRVVPGALPLLGVGAAFGFSRRLRRRVKNYRSPAQN
jgi:hypothetical protein